MSAETDPNKIVLTYFVKDGLWNGEDLEWMELSVTDALKEEVIASFKDIFNLDIANSPDLKLYAFTHYS